MIFAIMSAQCHSPMILIRNQFRILGSAWLQNKGAPLDTLMRLNVVCPHYTGI
jgi:hypothetical protein